MPSKSRWSLPVEHRSWSAVVFLRQGILPCAIRLDRALTCRGCTCADTMHALERVADRALQVGEAAVCSYRSHRSSQAQNAAILYQAVCLLLASTLGCHAPDSIMFSTCTAVLASQSKRRGAGVFKLSWTLSWQPVRHGADMLAACAGRCG